MWWFLAADAWSQEVVLLRGSDQDVADDDFWDALIKEMDSGEFDLLVITPLATRSCFLPGPRPLWNALLPWG